MAFSLLWALLSVALILVGWFHCRSHAFSYVLACKNSQCEWSTTNTSIPVVSFSKADFLGAEVVRVDSNGLYADTAMIKESRSKYGYSVRLKVRLPIENGSKLKTDKNFMFAPYDLGRRVSKSVASSMKDFLDNSKAADFRQSRGRMITALGVVCIFIGLVSLTLSCLFGQWMEINPRRMKKAS